MKLIVCFKSFGCMLSNQYTRICEQNHFLKWSPNNVLFHEILIFTDLVTKNDFFQIISKSLILCNSIWYDTPNSAVIFVLQCIPLFKSGTIDRIEVCGQIFLYSFLIYEKIWQLVNAICCLDVHQFKMTLNSIPS